MNLSPVLTFEAASDTSRQKCPMTGYDAEGRFTVAARRECIHIHMKCSRCEGDIAAPCQHADWLQIAIGHRVRCKTCGTTFVLRSKGDKSWCSAWEWAEESENEIKA